LRCQLARGHVAPPLVREMAVENVLRSREMLGEELCDVARHFDAPPNTPARGNRGMGQRFCRV
jgi:hypothetical protein